MSCWRCACGWKNCDTDTCGNPHCTETHIPPEKPERCCVCGLLTMCYIENGSGVKKPFCQHCYKDGTFAHYEAEFVFMHVEVKTAQACA